MSDLTYLRYLATPTRPGRGRRRVDRVRQLRLCEPGRRGPPRRSGRRRTAIGADTTIDVVARKDVVEADVDPVDVTAARGATGAGSTTLCILFRIPNLLHALRPRSCSARVPVRSPPALPVDALATGVDGDDVPRSSAVSPERPSVNR